MDMDTLLQCILYCTVFGIFIVALTTWAYYEYRKEMTLINYRLNQKEFYKNLLREFIFFVVVVILAYCVIGLFAMILYNLNLLGTGFLIKYQVSGDRHLIGTNNGNVLIIGFFIASIIWIIRMLRDKFVK